MCARRTACARPAGSCPAAPQLLQNAAPHPCVATVPLPPRPASQPRLPARAAQPHGAPCLPPQSSQPRISRPSPAALPPGLMDLGEEVGEATAREVVEQTNTDTDPHPHPHPPPSPSLLTAHRSPLTFHPDSKPNQVGVLQRRVQAEREAAATRLRLTEQVCYLLE